MTALLSSCRKYRYKLYRDVNKDGDKVIAYFGINPSTADETINDHTVKKWIGFTKRNNGKRLIAANVFAFRTTQVSELAKVDNPVGTNNIKHVMEVINESDVLVPCWGDRSKIPTELHAELDKFLILLEQSGKPVLCFGKTKSGDPKHPQMLGYETPLVKFGN